MRSLIAVLIGVDVVLPRAFAILGLETVVGLPRHLLAGAADDIGRAGIAGFFHIAVLAVPIWVSICHQLNPWIEWEQSLYPWLSSGSPLYARSLADELR